MFEGTLVDCLSGEFVFHLEEVQTGRMLAHWHRKNQIVSDAGILLARLCKNSMSPNPGVSNGIRMLIVGTGATGNVLSPDAPQATQRKLNTELARKAFSSTTFRNASGIAVAYPTNIVDFTATFGESEAVGALNEMAVIAPFSSDPAVLNPINNGPAGYDPTIDVTNLDIMANYLTFGCIVKPNNAILTITWRLTF